MKNTITILVFTLTILFAANVFGQTTINNGGDLRKRKVKLPKKVAVKKTTPEAIKVDQGKRMRPDDQKVILPAVKNVQKPLLALTDKRGNIIGFVEKDLSMRQRIYKKN